MLNPIPQDQIGNYFLGTASEVWVYKDLLLPEAAAVPTTGFTITAAALINATSLTITALTAPISRNQRIITVAGKCFIVTAPAASGATTLTVAPLKSAIAANDTAVFDSMVPLYTAMEAKIGSDGQETEIRNFGAGAYAIKGKTKIDVSFETNGYLTKGDPGLPLIRTAETGNGILFMHYVTPDDICRTFYAQVKSAETASKVDEYMTLPLGFTVGSAPVIRDFTLR